MLIIRKEQIQHFIAKDDAELAVVIATAIRETCTGRVEPYDDATLTEMVKIGIGRARSHKLDAAEDIAAFVAVMFEVAPRFDEQPDIRALLADENFSPSIRFFNLFDRVQDAAWLEAEKRYDDTFWFTK